MYGNDEGPPVVLNLDTTLFFVGFCVLVLMLIEHGIEVHQRNMPYGELLTFSKVRAHQRLG